MAETPARPAALGAGSDAPGREQTEERAALGMVRARTRAALAEAEELLRRVDPDWSPPPYDPLLVAQALGIRCIRMETPSASPHPALLCRHEDRPTILYRDGADARTRFNLFHEIAHTLFPDFRENPLLSRRRPRLFEPDGGLERLCDAAALEFMMPADLFEADLVDNGFGAARAADLCARYGVRPEEVCLRMIASDLECCGLARFEHAPGPRRRHSPQQERTLAMRYFVASDSFQDRGLSVSRRLELDRGHPLRVAARSKKAATAELQVPLLTGDLHPFRVEALPLPGRRRHGYSPVAGFFYPR